MTTAEVWDAIRAQCKTAWQFADAAGKDRITVEFFNSWSGTQVIGATGTLRNQLLACAAEIRVILMNDCEANFPNDQGVMITVNGVVPAPAIPQPIQFPYPPPIFSPPLPPTTPITVNDIVYCV